MITSTIARYLNPPDDLEDGKDGDFPASSANNWQVQTWPTFPWSCAVVNFGFGKVLQSGVC